MKLGVRAAALPCPPGTHALTSCSMPCLARCSLWTGLVIATALTSAAVALSPLTRHTALRDAATAALAGLDIAQCAGALLAATPPALHYTAAVLRANDAARRGDAGGWVDCINAMLAHWNTSGVRLLSRAVSLPGGGSGGSGEHDGLRRSPSSPAIDFISDLAPAVPPPPIHQPPSSPSSWSPTMPKQPLLLRPPPSWRKPGAALSWSSWTTPARTGRGRP